MVLCPNTDLQGGHYLAEIIAKQFSLLNIEKHDKNIAINLSLSIGVAVKTPEMLDYEALIKAADEGTYKAKSNGRNCIKSTPNYTG